MDVGSPLITDLQPPGAVQPRQRALHDPTIAAQALARLDALARQMWRDASAAASLAALGIVVSFVGVQRLLPLARASAPDTPPALARSM